MQRLDHNWHTHGTKRAFTRRFSGETSGFYTRKFQTRSQGIRIEEEAQRWYDSKKTYELNWKALRPFFEDRDPLKLDDSDWRDYARSRFALGRAPSTVHTEMSRLANLLPKAACKSLELHEKAHILK